MPLQEAANLARHDWMRTAMRTWARSKGWQLQDPPPTPIAGASAPPTPI